jgi:hypothetical protein
MNLSKLFCRNVSCLLLTYVLVHITQIPALAHSPVNQEIARANSLNRAALAAVEARLKLADWRLDRLHTLEHDGNATWIEVARAEVAVNELRAKLQAANEFAKFLSRLRTTIQEVIPERDKLEKNAESSGHAFTFALPGSVRLVSWLQLADMPHHTAHNHLERRRAMHQNTVASAATTLTDAEVASARAAEFFVRLKAAKGVSATELRRKELELTVARADLSIASAVHQNLIAEGKWLEQAGRDLITWKSRPNASATFAPISHSVDKNLHAATVAVAIAESNAVGELRAAEAALRKQRLRLQGFENLQHKGFVRQSEMNEARHRLTEAESLVTALRGQRNLLIKAAKQFSPHRADRSEISTVSHQGNTTDSAERIQLAAISESLLKQTNAVRHLIALRREFLSAEAERATFAAQHGHHQELHRKLQRIGNTSAGAVRELEFTQIDAEFAQARAQAADERKTALRLEELRFVTQFKCQSNRNGRGLQSFVEANDLGLLQVAITPVKHSPTDTDLVPAAYWYDPINVIRSLVRKPIVAEREIRRFPPPVGEKRHVRAGHENWALPSFLGDGWNFGAWLFIPTETLAPGGPYVLDGRMTAVYKRSPYDAATILYDNPAFFDYLNAIPSPLDAPTVFPQGSRIDYREWSRRPGATLRSLPSYSRWYQNGIRRSNVPLQSLPRRRANSYGSPWYIPGAPTNFDFPRR